MYNLRAWKEWCDEAPQPHMGGCIEAEFVNETGRLDYALIRHYHCSDERGSRWGHSTGSYREGDYKTHHARYYRWRFTGPIVPLKEAQGKSIIVWSYYDAPGELRCLSNHGGDEDWVALLPAGAERPSWMESGTSFGCCDVSEHTFEDGRAVFIGAHA
jgi:hypothetical protein